MSSVRGTLTLILALVTLASTVVAREWTDVTGNYQLEAELVGFDDESVILRRADQQLGAIPIDRLSAEDREYLKSPEADEIRTRSLGATQTWTTRSGNRLVGRIVDFVRREVTVQWRRGRAFVNDRPLRNLPEFYQQILPEVVQHFHPLPTVDRSGLERWLRSQRGQPRTFTLEGVVLELDTGDEYGIPFFLFADADRRILEAGWQEWLEVIDQYDQADDHAFRLQALAAAYARDREMDREIALMQLNMQAINAGLTSAWEVTLYPVPGNPQPPLWVVVPGRNSAQATSVALTQNPGFVAGPVRRVSR
jgi:hypothetical protein